MIELQKILTRTKELTLEVGGYIEAEAARFDHHKVELKGLNDLVSYVDKTAESRLVDGLHKILPEAGFIAEEGSASHNEEEFRWVVDPLDGTTNFTHGLPVYSISIALMQKEQVVLGVVYEINRQEMFEAVRGHGAYLNERRITVSSRQKLADSLLATGFPYWDFKEMAAYLRILDDFMKNTHGLRRMGSAAVDLAYVACGRFEGFFEYNLNAWDVAAGSLIVEEAGGTVTDFAGGDNFLFGREIIAAGHPFSEMQKVIAKHWNN
jgi:myo-inositol-1(or 4)-monophosphatase